MAILHIVMKGDFRTSSKIFISNSPAINNIFIKFAKVGSQERDFQTYLIKRCY